MIIFTMRDYHKYFKLHALKMKQWTICLLTRRNGKLSLVRQRLREHRTLEIFSKAPRFNKGNGGEENACIVHPEDSFPKDGILTPQLRNCELFNYLRSKKIKMGAYGTPKGTFALGLSLKSRITKVLHMIDTLSSKCINKFLMYTC